MPASAWLVCDGVRNGGRVLLNDHLLFELAGDGSPQDHDITGKLRPRNTLVFDIALAGPVPPGGELLSDQPAGEVRLESAAMPIQRAARYRRMVRPASGVFVEIARAAC